MQRRNLFLVAIIGLFWRPRIGKSDMPKPRLCIFASRQNAGDVHRPQRGDVVDILNTAQHPGRRVLGHPQWRIVDVDLQCDNPVREMAWLVAPDDAPEGYLRWFRRHTVDLDSLERLAARELGRPIADDDIITTGLGNIRALTKVKLALPDPRIIG